MTAPESKQTAAASGAPADEPDAARADQPVTTLRGARGDVDVRRAGQLVLGACLVALVITAVVLLIAGIQKNNQIDSLRSEGVPVAVRVVGCEGLLGGSGSNAAGYACTGAYSVDGHPYSQSIPGTGLLKPGEVIRGITVPDDPTLVSTPAQLAGEHASWTVYVVPVVLLLVAILVGWVLVARRRRRPGAGAAAKTSPTGSR